MRIRTLVDKYTIIKTLVDKYTCTRTPVDKYAKTKTFVDKYTSTGPGRSGHVHVPGPRRQFCKKASMNVTRLPST